VDPNSRTSSTLEQLPEQAPGGGMSMIGPHRGSWLVTKTVLQSGFEAELPEFWTRPLRTGRPSLG
jgi:hypothetical protein